MSVSQGEREREKGRVRANQKSCSRQSVDRARITCRGCDDSTMETVEREREREERAKEGAQIGTPSHSEIVMLWPLMAST